ncbi:MAG: hypothetical protein ACTHK8_20955 [Ginsengibacter sp.]
MKKMFTLFIAATGTFGFASAQSYQKSVAYNDHQKTINDHRQKDIYRQETASYPGQFNSYNEKVEKINREYDRKIAMVENNRHLNRRQKARQIERLQNQRKKELSQFNYANRYQHSDDKRFDNDKHQW